MMSWCSHQHGECAFDGDGETSLVSVVGFEPGRRFFCLYYSGWPDVDFKKSAEYIVSALEGSLPEGTSYHGGLFSERLSEEELEECPFEVFWNEAEGYCEHRWAEILLDFGFVGHCIRFDFGEGRLVACGRSPSLFCFRTKGTVIGEDGRAEEVPVIKRVWKERECFESIECVAVFSGTVTQKCLGTERTEYDVV